MSLLAVSWSSRTWSPFQTRQLRQAQLLSRFGFQCACPACSLTGAGLEESDRRRVELARLDEQIRSSKDVEEVLTGAFVPALRPGAVL